MKNKIVKKMMAAIAAAALITATSVPALANETADKVSGLGVPYTVDYTQGRPTSPAPAAILDLPPIRPASRRSAGGSPSSSARLSLPTSPRSILRGGPGTLPAARRSHSGWRGANEHQETAALPVVRVLLQGPAGGQPEAPGRQYLPGVRY